MRLPLLIVAATLMSCPAYAGIFEDIGQSIGRAVEGSGQVIGKAQQDMGHTVDKGAHETGSAAEQAAQQQAEQKIETVKLNAFIEMLGQKNDSQLLAQSFFPCTNVDCNGISIDNARQAVNLVRAQKQSQIDLGIRQSQAQAAEISAAMSFLGLIISIASFVKAGRPPKPQAQNS